MKIKSILLLFLILLITISCSNNTSDNTTDITIQLNNMEENLSYIIKINPEEQPEHVDFNAMYPSSNAFIYENEGFSFTLETDLTYEINVYHSETEIPSDFTGDLAEYMDEHAETAYYNFNEQNNTLIIDL
jgi:hypothetical protein